MDGSPAAIEQTLREAIEERRPVRLRYDGGGDREVQPHAVFRGPSGGLCLHAYQVAGATSSGGALPGWRLFNVAKIDEATPSEGRFDVAPGFNPAGRMYAHGLIARARP